MSPPAAVAFVPAAPLLVPAIAGGSAELDAALREDCLTVVGEALAGDPGAVVVVAATATTGEWPATARPDFSGFGVGTPPDAAALPWPLGVGAWLLEAAGYGGDRRYLGVDGASAAAAAPGSATGVRAVIAVGDGSACRTERAPGHLDPRAEPFDAAVATALANGDVAGLAATDQSLAEALLCRSVPVWRWVAGVIGDGAVAKPDLRRHDAPYGVAYFAALWQIS